VGPSSGAILHVALKKAAEIKSGVMVAIAPDGGEKYLSTTLCDPMLCLKCARKHGIRCSYTDGSPCVGQMLTLKCRNYGCFAFLRFTSRAPAATLVTNAAATAIATGL